MAMTASNPLSLLPVPGSSDRNVNNKHLVVWYERNAMKPNTLHTYWETLTSVILLFVRTSPSYLAVLRGDGK